MLYLLHINNDAMPSTFKPVNLPAETIGKLRRLKYAISFSSGKLPSYSEVIDTLLESLQKTNPGLYNTFMNVKDSSVESL